MHGAHLKRKMIRQLLCLLFLKLYHLQGASNVFNSMIYSKLFNDDFRLLEETTLLSINLNKLPDNNVSRKIGC